MQNDYTTRNRLLKQDTAQNGPDVVSPLLGTIAHLNAEILCVQSMFLSLQERLNPVLVDLPEPTKPDSGQPPKSQSYCVATLGQCAGLIAELKEQIASTKKRLDL